jgi:hypothetical protein
MALRREIMNYVGTGAIGGIVGYYVGAQGLLGIQSEEVARPPQEEDQSSQDDDQSPENEDSTVTIFDDFEDGDLDNPQWEAVGAGPAGLAEQNEIGVANDGYQSQHSLYLDQGGSFSNFKAEATLEQRTSPSEISFWLKPTGADQYTKNRLELFDGDTIGIQFSNHIEDDVIYFRSGEGSEQIRDTAISPNVDQFVEINMRQIGWNGGTIGEVRIDGEAVSTDVPFENDVSGFDKIHFAAIGGGGTTYRVDDIGWQ